MLNKIGIIPLGQSRRRAAFSPLSLSPVLWLNFSDISTLFTDSAGTIPVTADGDVIGYAADKSGNGNHATQATTLNKPLWKAAIQNGLGAGLWDGSNDYLLMPRVLAQADTSYTQVLVAKLQSPFSALRLVFQQVPTAQSSGAPFSHSIQLTTTPLFRADTFPPSGGTFNSATVSTGTRLASYIQGGTSQEWRVDGASSSTGSGGETYSCVTAINQAVLGVYLNMDNLPPTTVFPYAGHICEFLVFSESLDAGQLEQLETYLNDKWNIY